MKIRVHTFMVLLAVLLLALPGTAQTVSDTADPFPEDAVLALSSTVAQMRGWPIDGMPVSLMPGGQFQFAEKAFRYDGFKTSTVELLDLKFLSDNPLHRYMQAVIHFTDANGRLALAQMAAEYALYENQGIMLRNVATWPLFTHSPRFEMYIVPVPLLEAKASEIVGNFERMYAFAKKNNATSGSGEFALMLFSKDRIGPNTSLEFILSSDPNETDVSNSMTDFAMINDNGWVVAVAQGPARPGDMYNLLYVNVYHTCTHGKRTLTGTFDTSMQPSPPAPLPFQNPWQRKVAGQPDPQSGTTAAHQQPTWQEQQLQVQQTEGPLGQGRVLLNPIMPEHVRTIQLRLQRLGYYQGPIDMEFGPLTQRALGNFAQQHGMPRNQWSLDLQKALFLGSGQ